VAVCHRRRMTRRAVQLSAHQTFCWQTDGPTFDRGSCDGADGSGSRRLQQPLRPTRRSFLLSCLHPSMLRQRGPSATQPCKAPHSLIPLRPASPTVDEWLAVMTGARVSECSSAMAQISPTASLFPIGASSRAWAACQTARPRPRSQAVCVHRQRDHPGSPQRASVNASAARSTPSSACAIVRRTISNGTQTPTLRPRALRCRPAPTRPLVSGCHVCVLHMRGVDPAA
jgi:hypothetical protein